jgi:hypothetical protein
MEKLPDRTYIGIGKILFDTPGADWNIPNLHFLVSRCDGNLYEAVNLEFGLVSIGESSPEAAEGLVKLILTYLAAVLKKDTGFKELQESVRTNFLPELWGEYRGIEFERARTGGDTPSITCTVPR